MKWIEKFNLTCHVNKLPTQQEQQKRLANGRTTFYRVVKNHDFSYHCYNIWNDGLCPPQDYAM